MNYIKFTFLIIFVSWQTFSQAQLTNYQHTETKTYFGPTLSFTNTIGTSVGNLNFLAGGAGIPFGHKIVDVDIEIVWSKTDNGYCRSITGVVPDLSHVGFTISAPGFGTRYLAASNAIGSFVGTTSSFAGRLDVVSDTTVFKAGYPSLLPATAPVIGRDTVAPNNFDLDLYIGRNPYGSWNIGGVDDSPSAGSALCIHSYKITLVTCENNTIEALCKHTVEVAIDSNGTHNFEFVDVDSLSDISCLTKSITFSPASIDCSQVGTTIPVTMFLRDKLDSTANCTANVRVIDNQAPIISNCTPNTWNNIRYLDPSGVDTFFATEAVVSDNCNSYTKEVKHFTARTWSNQVVFSCVTRRRRFWVKASDPYGNSDSCLVVVNYTDTIKPTAVCGNYTAYLDNTPNNGSVIVNPIDIDGGSFDICPPIFGYWIGHQFSTPPTYTCADLGNDTVQLVVIDVSSNLDSCNSAIITVVDTFAPVAKCNNSTVYLDAFGIASINTNSINNNSFDNCFVDSLNINGQAVINFDCSHLNNSQSITLNLFDASNNHSSCQSSILVLDTFPPTPQCKNISIYLDATGNSSIPVHTLNNNSIDLCTGTNLSFSVAGSTSISFNCNDMASNPNPIKLMVRDSFGNTDSCTSYVTVVDTIAPIVSCVSPSLYLDASGIVYLHPADLCTSSYDNCGRIDSFINTIGNRFATFDCSSIGTAQTATLIITDPYGNVNSCVSSFQVFDTIAPISLCKRSISLSLDNSGHATVHYFQIDSNSNDNCGLAQYFINGLDSVVYSCADLGTRVATLLVRDSLGNADSCATNIRIEDHILPRAACRTNISYLNHSGVAILYPDSFVYAPSTFDNCGTVTASFANGSISQIYTCDSIGIRPITISVVDNFGNISSCTTNVTIIDSIAPNVYCRPAAFIVVLDTTNNAVVHPMDIDNGSTDFCGIDSFLLNGLDSLIFDCSDIGMNTVNLIAFDSSGNQGFCQANIMVQDLARPIAICRDKTIYLNSSGTASLLPSDIDGGSSDNCSTVSLLVNGNSIINYKCAQISTSPVQLSVTDLTGNVEYCIANVTLSDTITPIAYCASPGSISVYLDSNCFASVPATSINNNSLDNCSAFLTYTVNGLPNAIFNANNITTNPNPVTLVVRDITGNFSTCTTSVMVYDTIAPKVLCHPDTLQLVGPSVILTPPTINTGSIDNCAIPSLSLNGQPFLNYNCTDLGLNTVVLIGTDLSGNTDSCTTTIFIEDAAAPLAICQLNFNIPLDPVNNLAIITPSMINNNSVDNCTISSYRLSKDTFDCSDIYTGQQAVSLFVTDQSGNISSCVTYLTISDTIAPVAQCKSRDTLYYSGSTLQINPSFIDLGSTDNCFLQSMSINQDTFGCSDIGLNIITLSLRDSSGNTSSCFTEVIIIDTLANAIAGANQVLCTSDSTILGATPITTAGVSSLWTSSSAATILNPNSATTSLLNIPVGTHTFYWTLSTAFCSSFSSDSVVITVISPSSDTAFAGIDQSICQDTTITLAANTPNISTGIWIQDSLQSSIGTIVNQPNNPNTTISGILPNRHYTFVWQLVNGLCGVHSTDTVVIQVDDTTNIQAFAGYNVICSPDTLTLAADTTSIGTGSWSSPHPVLITNPSLATTSISNMTLDTTMMIWSLSNGTCLDYSQDTVYIIKNAPWPIAVNDSFHLIANGTPQTINVTDNDSLPNSWTIFIQTPMIEGINTNLHNGLFEIDITNAKQTQYFVYNICNSICLSVCDSAEVTVSIESKVDCYIPNTFTPNGDGSNDLFVIPCISSSSQKASLRVFNRWGNIVFETDNYISDWDGTHKNQPLPDGTYFYILQLGNKTPQRGSIEIKK